MSEERENNKPSEARIALADNLGHLMAYYSVGFDVGIKAPELAKAVGIHSRTIKRMLDPYSIHSPQLVSIDAVASHFKIPAWQLLRPRPKAVQTQAIPAAPNDKPSKARK
jgi:hypothetical protein